MSKISAVKEALAAGEGIVRLAPCWVPRSFLMPGGRLKLDPRDLYALGAHRGGIDERWFSSTTKADNGPGTPEDEGLSYIAANGKRVLLKEAVESIGDDFLGADVMRQYGGWNVLCKFFDNLGPIPHHMHQMDEHARRVGAKGKPEAYYFPPQYNFTGNNFPYTFMGLEPGTTKDDVRRCLERWNEGDNGILYLAKAYRLKPGTGWQIDAGILHAPGSLVTYEPQVNSDVFGMFQSMVEGRPVPWDLLVKDVPKEHHHDLDYIIGMLDWEANVDPEFAKHRLFHPKPVKAEAEMQAEGYSRKVGGLHHSLLLREGADRAARPQRHHQGRRRLRRHPHAGPRRSRQARRGDALHDPLRPDDQGRILRHRLRRTGRRAHRQQERQGRPGHAEALRTRQPRRERSQENEIRRQRLHLDG